MPNPPNDTSLNLGVAATRRYLAAAPAHPRAVRGTFEIGAAYQARGKDTEDIRCSSRRLPQAEEGFKIETDEARRDWAELSMTASFQVGRILLGQQKFAEAIAAWRGYLARFSNGPQSADAQRAILEAQLLIAADHKSRGHFPEARAAWSEFVSLTPLDERLPAILFQIGESFEPEKQFDRAIAAWEPLTSKFPGSEPAAHAQFAIAAIFETEKGDPTEAIERFRKITVQPWQAQAHQRIAVMESKHLRGRHAAHLPVRRGRPFEDHHAEPRDAQLHCVQAQCRGLLPQEERADERRGARHRPGRARCLMDRPGARLCPVQAGRGIV